MRKNAYKKRIEKWFESKALGKGIKESFQELDGSKNNLCENNFSYTDWLILPGNEKELGFTEELGDAWNSLLADVFARSKRYRKEENELWERLKQIYKLEKENEESTRSREYSLINREAPVTNTEIIGREKELAQIAELFGNKEAVFLYGIGGIGKSTVARAYAQKYSECYKTIIYASCESNLKELFADDLRIPVHNLQYVPTGKRGEKGWYVRHKLEIFSKLADKKTLLIIDNFDRLNDGLIDRVLQLPCCLLLTTRINPEYPGVKKIEIQALEGRSNQLRLFELYYGKALTSYEEQAAMELMSRFQWHTLYIKRLAGYCAETGKSPCDLLDETAVWKDTVFRLKSLSKKEQQVLLNASLLPVEGMNLNEFLRLSVNIKPEQVQRLVRRGLVECGTGESRIALHPLIRQEIIEVLHPKWTDCRNYVRSYASDTEQFWNLEISQKMRHQIYITVMLDTLPRIEEEFMDIIFALADLLWQMGQWDYAERYTKELYKSCRKAFGSPHPYTAEAANLAAAVYHNRNEREKAAYWYAKCWNDYEKWTEKDPFKEAMYTMKYSRCFSMKKDFGRAGKLLLRAEELYNREIEEGRDVRRMSAFLMNTFIEHTRVCLRQNKYREALKFCEKAEQLSVSLKGGPTSKAYIYHDAAVIWEHLGDKKRAGYYLDMAEKCARGYFAESILEYQNIQKELKRKENK